MILATVMAMTVVGCKEEDNGLTFSTLSIEDPENVSIRYSSPDPGCGVPEMYSIGATSKENEILLECDNASSIYIQSPRLRDNESSEYKEIELDDPDEVELGSVNVKIVNGNQLRITFDEVSFEETAGDDSDFVIGANTKDGYKYVYFQISRGPRIYW